MTLELIQQLEDTEQYEKAYELCKNMTAKSPKNIDVLERQAHLAILLNKQEEAINIYNKILDVDMNNTLALSQLMDLYCENNKFLYYTTRGSLHTIEGLLSHAVNDYKKALAQTDNEYEVLSTRLVIASLYEDLNKPNQAIDEYLHILELPNVNETAYLNLAKIYETQDFPAEAVETLERAVQKGFNSEEITNYLANLCIKNGFTEKARTYSEDKIIVAKSLLDENKNEEAFALLTEIEKNNKKNPKYYSLLAQYYYNLKDFDKALLNIEEFTKFDKNSPLSFQMRALIYEELNEDFDAHLNWGKFYLKKGDKDIALNEFLQADNIKNDNTDLIYSVAQLFEQTGNNHQAMEFYERFSKFEPNDITVLNKIAAYKENIGDWFTCMKISEQIFEKNKKDLINIKRLAKVHEKLKNKDRSIEYYELFLKHAPVSDETVDIKKKLENLKNNSNPLSALISSLFSK